MAERFSRREFFRRSADAIKERALSIPLALQIYSIAKLGISALQPPKVEANPLPEVPEQTVTFWNGQEKRKVPGGSRKFIFIPGMNTEYKDDNSFRYIKEALSQTGNYNNKDFLDMTYRVHTSQHSTDTLGERYTREDSIQNPLESLENMKKMMDWIQTNFPEDEFWFLGHSQGGFLAFQLAAQLSQSNPELLGGVITFDAPLKGAGITNTILDPGLAHLVGGEAAEYLTNLAQSPVWEDIVEKQAKDIQKSDSILATFADTEDPVVRDEYAYLPTSNTKFKGETIKLRFPMGVWKEWKTVEVIQKQVQEHLKYFDTGPTSESSARLRNSGQFVTSDYTHHGAVLENGDVRRSVVKIVEATPSKIKTIGRPKLPDLEHPPARQEPLGREEAVGYLRNDLLAGTDYQGFTGFSIRYDVSRNKYTITLENSDGRKNLDRYLISFGISSLTWLENYEISERIFTQPEQG